MRTLIALILLAGTATPLHAQLAEQRFPEARDSARATHDGTLAPMRIAKWGTLLASTGAAVYGFTQNRAADREYEEIERMCEDTPASCLTTSNGTTYADAALESRYQAVLRRDDRARFALLAGQIGIAASVLMFIIDLPKGSTPEDIPYEPRPLRLGVAGDQLHVGIRLSTR